MTHTYDTYPHRMGNTDDTQVDDRQIDSLVYTSYLISSSQEIHVGDTRNRLKITQTLYV